MKMKKCGLLLSILFLVGIWIQADQTTAFAADTYADIPTVTRVNPVYKDIISESDLDFFSYDTMSIRKRNEYQTEDEQIAELIREGMTDRESVIHIYYKSREKYSDNQLVYWVDLAMSETDQSNQGDYLQWCYGGYSISGGYTREDGYYLYHFIYNMDYYTTKEQEQEFALAVAETLDDIGVLAGDLSDYEKTERIYRYIADHVSYDYDHVNDNSYTLQYTAYAAMIQKKAVCQGYATLLYYMLEEADVDCRVVSGYASGEAHGWNLIGVDGLYYWGDVTWDAGKENFRWFLKGNQEFSNHTVNSDFIDEYEISEKTYVWDENSPTPTPTPEQKPTPTPKQSFDDISEDDWYYDSVGYVYENGIMTGMTDTIFGPLERVSRAQFAVMLYRLQGCPKVVYEDIFADVEDGLWYTDAVLWANKVGIVTGYSNGMFGPADYITREQMATMLYRYAGYTGLDTSGHTELSAFKDSSSVSEFAKEGVTWAVNAKVITGKDAGTRLAPQEVTARAECAAILMRFMEHYEE